MMISLIAAVGTNRVIGHEGKIPWYVPRDFRFFKKATTGCPCIMGRKTFDSLPGPLPERLNLVLTRHPHLVNVKGGNVLPHAEWRHLLNKAIQYAENNHSPRIVIMGGEDVYRQFMPLAHELLLTRIRYDGPGDTFFPELPPNEWELVETMDISEEALVQRYGRCFPETIMPLFP